MPCDFVFLLFSYSKFSFFYYSVQSSGIGGMGKFSLSEYFPSHSLREELHFDI